MAQDEDSGFNEHIARLVTTARTDGDYRRINELLAGGPQGFAQGGDIAVGYNEGGEVDAVEAKSTEQPSRPEPFQIPAGQIEARLREFNRLDPATQSLITRNDPRVQFALTPAPASVSAPYTLSTMPGARALYDQTLAGTTTGGYVHPALRMQDRSSLKQVPTQDVVFLRPGREKAEEVQSRAHEAEHLLAKRGLGDATAINDKFDELMKDSKARRAFVEGAVKVQPYLEKTYGTKSTYFMPEMLAFQDKRGRGANLLYEQFAELAAIEQATGKDLTKDPELRKTIFKDKKVREVYNSLTGLRQTRLDARDLAPYTPIPEKPEGVMEFIRGKLGFKDGGEVSDDSAKSRLEAMKRVESQIVDEKLRDAANSSQYGDLVEFLASRRVMPEMKYRPGISGEFVSGWGMPNRGEINLGMSATPGTVVHELTHAADRQISQQYYDLAKKRKLDPLEKQFVQTYEKLVFSPDKSQRDPEKYPRTAMAERLAPEWAKRERGYRSTPGEMVAFGMGRPVDEAQRYMPSNIAPPHVDPTMATEFSVLLDIAKRLQKSKPVTDKR